MGAIAAKSKLKGEHPRNENNYLVQARATFEEQEEYIRVTTTYPPSYSQFVRSSSDGSFKNGS